MAKVPEFDPARSEMPEFDPRNILFHGSGFLAINKPAGMPVHCGTAHPFGVVEVIAEWVRQNPGVLDVRPGKPIHPIHRLDLEASGVLLLGLTRPAARTAKGLFAAGAVGQRYLTVVAGPVAETGRLRGRVRARVGRKYEYLPTDLSYRRLRGDDRLSLVEVTPHGSRKHQIRALFAQAGRPLAGDLRYGKPKPSHQFLSRFALDHFLLHNTELVLPPTVLGAEKTIAAPVPDAFRELCERKGWELVG